MKIAHRGLAPRGLLARPRAEEQYLVDQSSVGTEATQTAGKDTPVSFTFHFESTTGVFPASRYQEWQSACSGAVEAWQSPIKIE